MSVQLMLGEWVPEINARELERELEELKNGLVRRLRQELLYGDERSICSCPDPTEELKKFMERVKQSDIPAERRKRLLSEAEDLARELGRAYELIDGIAHKLMHKEYEGDANSPEFKEAEQILGAI